VYVFILSILLFLDSGTSTNFHLPTNIITTTTATKPGTVK